ncbi:PAS domain S-box protein [Patescibacteria group bacterium]|nr:PAS domain S-box protein [Patescibacteria group bacterium]
MYPTIYRYGLLGVVVSSFLVSFIVYIKAYQDNKKSAFLLVNTATGIWALCLFIFHTYHEPQIFWLRFSHLAAIFVPVTFIHFVFVLLDEISQRKRWLTLFYLIALILGLLSFTKLSIAGITYKGIMGYHLIPGPIYKVFNVMFFLLVLYGFLLMIKALKKSSGFQKNQIRYFLLGSILGFGGAISTFLPLYNVNIPPLGVLAIPGYGIILAYAILKHRLMDMRTVISKGLIYSATTILLFVLVLLLEVIVVTHYKITLPTRFFLYILGLCFFLVLVLKPMRAKLEQLVEKLIFGRSRIAYEELRKGSRELVTILDNKVLVRFFLKMVVRATGVNWGKLWLIDEKTGDCRLVARMGKERDESWLNGNYLLRKNLPLIRLLEEKKKPLLREEIFPLLKKSEDENIEDKLGINNLSLVIPVFFKDSLKGCLFLGEKKSGDVFSPYELHTLTLLSDEAAIAIANAQLFQQIQRMKEYNESIINNVDSGLIVINEEGKIATFNQKAEEMTGLSLHKVLNETAEILISPLDEIIPRCWQTKKSISLPEVVLKLGKNHTLVVNLNTSFIDEGKERVGMVIILTDLSEVKKLDEKIRQAEKMASIGSMVSQLAHEIKNPLSSIKVFTELLPEKFQDEEFRKKFFSIVYGEIERIDSLINRMLNLHRITAAQYEMASIDEIIEDVLSSLSLQIRNQGIKVKVSHCQDLSQIWVDQQSLKEAFSNILINSIQAMPQGGNITISTRKRKDKNTTRAILEINFTDEGGGIPRNCLNKVFEPFFTTKSQGSGLGLYICYQIVQAHQGKIGVRNTGLGAEFTVLLAIVEK